jgi:hypothetical protein
VVSVGTASDPALCRLKQLQWNKGDKGAGKTVAERLGSGDDGTVGWASADTRYLLLVDVALGECKDYGREEPNIRGNAMPREPEGYHSVRGTEQDLSADGKVRLQPRLTQPLTLTSNRNEQGLGADGKVRLQPRAPRPLPRRERACIRGRG